MSQLLYCVFLAAERSTRAARPGVNGRAVVVVGYRGIGCAISSVDPTDIVPDRVRIITYENVVESFHREHTVIPMRYGCVLDDELTAVRFLRENRKRFRSLLAELRDCVEMGIRVLVEARPRNPAWFEKQPPESPFAKGDFRQCCHALSHARNPRSAEEEISGAQSADGAGASYLRARKGYYQGRDSISEEAARLTKQVGAAMDGLYVKLETEGASGERPLSPFRGSVLSLNFLVPRDRVEPFRAAFRGLEETGGSKFLISGPWPPYNFALSDGGFGTLERQSRSFDFHSR